MFIIRVYCNMLHTIHLNTVRDVDFFVKTGVFNNMKEKGVEKTDTYII